MSISKLFRLRRGDSQSHTVYAVTFTIIAVVALVGLIMVNTEADNGSSSQSTSVTNTPPIVFNLITAESSNLGSASGDVGTSAVTIANTAPWDALYFRGVAQDYNGTTDIDSMEKWNLKAFVTSATENCTPAQRTCYGGVSNSTYLSFQDVDTYTLNFEWNLPMAHVVSPTDDTDDTWTAKVDINDDSNADSSTTDVFEIASNLALDVPASTSFSGAVGARTTTTTVVVTNTGNIYEDYNVGVDAAMTCSGVGTIPAANQAFAKDPGSDQGSVSTPIGTATQRINATIANATVTTSSSTDTAYTSVNIPAGVRGSCTNTATYVARPNETAGF